MIEECHPELAKDLKNEIKGASVDKYDKII